MSLGWLPGLLALGMMSLGVRTGEAMEGRAGISEVISRDSTVDGPSDGSGTWGGQTSTAQQGSAQTNAAITLNQANPSSPNYSATIVAPGRGLHNYNMVKIDTTAFKRGGVLDIGIRISDASHTDGSFDLFPAGAVLPKAGSTKPSLEGRYDVRRGTSAVLEYRFSAGQIFGLGLEGNWFNPKGASGSVQITASVRANAASSGLSLPEPASASNSSLKVLPIVYGPTIQPGGQNFGLCIYLGGRKAAGLEPKANYNWVQTVCASDNGCPGKSPFVDNRPPTKGSKVGSYAPDSNFYRNNDAVYYTGNFVRTWVDPQDHRPFDYVFFDLPGREVSELDKVKNIQWSATMNSVRSDPGGLLSCASDRREPSSGRVTPYCKESKITYGYSLHVLDGLKSLVYRYRMDIDALKIDGVEVAPAASYGVSMRGPSYAFISKLNPLTGLPAPSLPMTFVDFSHSENVCQYDFVKTARAAKDATKDDSTGPPPQEPAKFQKPFTSR